MFQLKLPVEISTIIEISDPVYTFCEVMDSIDLRKYLAALEISLSGILRSIFRCSNQNL